jgi:hypothetical protein
MGGAVFALRDTRHQLEVPLYALHCTDDHITPYQVGPRVACTLDLQRTGTAVAIPVSAD